MADKESWYTLQDRYGVDAKKIIYANFETMVPSEINWYLRSYVGCNKPTSDGKNWTFSSSAKPGIIQIPPKEIVFEEGGVIIGTVPPLYYTVTDSPNAWAPPPGLADGGVTAKQVVTMAPWQRSKVRVGSVVATGRAGWGAKTPVWANEVIYYNTFALPLTSLYETIVIHHTNNSQSINYNENKQMSKGYAAMGYHFFIAQNGQVFEGRPLEVMGSHAGAGTTPGALNDPDWGSIGIVMQGDYHNADNWAFNSDPPPAAQLTALENVVVGLRTKYPIGQILMHREVTRGGTPTVCPGDVMVPYVEALRKKLGLAP